MTRHILVLLMLSAAVAIAQRPPTNTSEPGGGRHPPRPRRPNFLVRVKARTCDDEIECSGSLISRHFVVTAAHCVVRKMKKGTPILYQEIIVIARNGTKPDGQVIPGFGTPFPLYMRDESGTGDPCDIAVVQLRWAVVFSEQLMPIKFVAGDYSGPPADTRVGLAAFSIVDEEDDEEDDSSGEDEHRRRNLRTETALTKIVDDPQATGGLPCLSNSLFQYCMDGYSSTDAMGNEDSSSEEEDDEEEDQGTCNSQLGGAVVLDGQLVGVIPYLRGGSCGKKRKWQSIKVAPHSPWMTQYTGPINWGHDGRNTSAI